MPRWMRVIRGMIGTGLTFAGGVGVLASIAGLVGLLAGAVSAADVLALAGKLSVVSFIVGVAFSGVLAIAARGRTFDKISLRFVTTLGVGVGLLYFGLISISGSKVWTVADAIGNLVILTLMGGGLAAGTLILARKARSALNRGEELRSLSEGGIERPLAEREAAQKSRV